LHWDVSRIPDALEFVQFQDALGYTERPAFLSTDDGRLNFAASYERVFRKRLFRIQAGEIRSVCHVVWFNTQNERKTGRNRERKCRRGKRYIYIFFEVMKFEVLKAVKKSIFDIWWLYWPHCPFAIGSN
jgi:hypothetical protein